MKISIVMPAYNHAEFIEESLQSLIAEKKAAKDFELELIVIDGGSTDGTVDIIKRYKNKLDYWVSEQDRGQTDALLKGFAQATGDIMAWVNSDDLLLPGAIKTIYEWFKAYPEIDCAYGDAKIIDRQGNLMKYQKEIDFDLDIFLWGFNYFPQPSTFWRRSLWEKSGGLNPAFNCAMDYDLWMKFIRIGANINHIPVVLSKVRRYPEQKNQFLRKESNSEDHSILEGFLNRKVSLLEKRRKSFWHRLRRIKARYQMGAYKRVKEAG